MGSTLSFNGYKFIFEPDGVSHVDEHNAHESGFKWNEDSLRWEARSPQKAVLLRRFADHSAEQKLKNHFITDYPPPEQILYPDHLQPKLFQIESAFHCLTRSPAYCADEAGLGKTITAILCMNTVPSRVLVVCPPFLKYNWADEINKWSIKPRNISVIEDGKPNGGALCSDVVILPDSLITSPVIKLYLRKHNFTWGFVDEAHRYGDGDSQRTQSLVGSDDEKQRETYFTVASAVERIVFLSGTPIPNGKPIALYPLLSRVAPESIGHRSKLDYGKRFCGARQVSRYEGKRVVVNWDFSGASNLKGLRKRLLAKLMVRHLKKDVLDELPPKTRKLVFLDTPKKLEKFEKKLLGYYTFEDLTGKTNSTIGEIAHYQRQVGEAKIKPALEYIRDLLESSPDKLIVGAHHISVVEDLFQGLRDFGSLMIRGGMTPQHKANTVKAFQTDKRRRVMVGNIHSMGVGNTLTAARGCIIVEPLWNPGLNEQLEDRIHRMTQEANTYFRYLVLRGSLDERKLRRVLEKEKNIKEVMG